jgi:hypothetical protein
VASSFGPNSQEEIFRAITIKRNKLGTFNLLVILLKIGFSVWYIIFLKAKNSRKCIPSAKAIGSRTDNKIFTHAVLVKSNTFIVTINKVISD